MRSDAEVREVFRLTASGLPQAEVARRVGIARATVRDWLRAGEAAVLARPMRRAASAQPLTPCTGECPGRRSLDEEAYAYLLGQTWATGA